MFPHRTSLFRVPCPSLLATLVRVACVAAPLALAACSTPTTQPRQGCG